MSVTLYLQDVEEILFNSENQTYLTDKAGTQELLFDFNHHFLKGSFTEIILPNFKISYGSSNITEKTIVLFESTIETVEMHFTINGSSSTFINGIKKDYGVQDNSHNIFYGKDLDGKMTWKSNEMFFFEVNLNPIFFESYLLNNPLFNAFKKKMSKNEATSLSEHNHPITPQMLLIINQIINCNFKDEFRRLFLEAKVLELLLLQLEQIETCSSCFDDKKMIKEKNDIEKMHFVKELIDENLFSKLTLSQLSNEIQSNECTLKRAFKSAFNTSVFSYIKEQKMLRAKQMLLDNNITINEVSDFIGYKNPQHFSTAFKKYFGYVPSVLLK